MQVVHKGFLWKIRAPRGKGRPHFSGKHEQFLKLLLCRFHLKVPPERVDMKNARTQFPTKYIALIRMSL